MPFLVANRSQIPKISGLPHRETDATPSSKFSVKNTEILNNFCRHDDDGRRRKPLRSPRVDARHSHKMGIRRGKVPS